MRVRKRKLAERVWIAASLLPLMAAAEPPARANNGASDTVVVIRGNHVQGDPPKGAESANRAAASSDSEPLVIVMRPAPGSFMRETSRLVAEAEAREERAAREDAREANRRLSEAMAAVRNAATAVEEQSREARYVVVTSHQRRGGVNQKTDKYFPGVAGGVVDPEMGRFIPTP